MKMNMEELITNLIDAMGDLVEGKELTQRKILRGNGYVAKLTVDEGVVKFSIRTTEHCPECDTPESKEQQTKQAQCNQIRKDFYKYTSSLDESVFNTVCKQFEWAELKSMNNTIENNNTNPELMQEAIDTFKKLADTVIMDKVNKLKSQMSNYPQQ